MDRAAFQSFHPVVPTTLFVGIILLAMFGLEPYLVALSLVFAVLFALATQGVAAALDKLRWQIPLLILICIINPLFNVRGTHLLFRLGPFLVYAESVAYGLVMGALLISVLMWIENMAYLIGNDELLVLGGGVLPTVALMLSMTMRLVPQLISRATTVRTALQATTSARASRTERATRVRVMDALMSWALEDSLERSDAMRARGWGAVQHRTSFDAHPFRKRDLIALGAIACIIVLAALGVRDIVGGWNFYPSMASSASAVAYLPVAVLFSIPLAVIICERIWWEVHA